jgi:hypothetical protein
LELSEKNIGSVTSQAWRYLFEAWEENRRNLHGDEHKLKAVIDREGWNRAAIRMFAVVERPYLKAERDPWSGPKPPEWKKDISTRDMLRLHVEYPSPMTDVEIPDDWLVFALPELRKNLEYALCLETELGGNGLNNISPIISDDVPDGDHYGRTHGLSGSLISFSSLFERLIEFDIASAKRELQAWPVNDDTIFSQLRIWASGKSELVSIHIFGKVISELSDDAFWNSYHQRDLLVVLARRWCDLPKQKREKIENRLLRGPSRWEREDKTDFEERKARASLNRLHWLANNGCELTFDLKAKTKELQGLATKWTPEYATKAAESMEGRGGAVRTETEHSALLDEPIDNILKKALELSGKQEDFLVEKDPFAGLCAESPVRAFSTLTNAAKRDEYPAWAWRTFLYAEGRKSDKPRFSALIAERISRYPEGAVAQFIHPASDWILKISERLALSFPQTFDRVISKFVKVLRLQQSSGGSAIVRAEQEPDWVMEAINAPVGKLSQALFNDPRKDDLEEGGGFPAEWLVHADNFLSLDGDLRRYALVIFAHNMNWFHAIDPGWADVNMLSVLDSGSQADQNAIWSGFLSGARPPKQELYMRLKPHLLIIGKQRSVSRRGYGEVLAGIILTGWCNTHNVTGERYISNAELQEFLLHTDEEICSQILWQVERWITTEDSTDKKWAALALELLRDVWPLQKSAKTPAISARLFDLAFSDVEWFPQLAEIVLPLLTTADRDHSMLRNLRKTKDTIVGLYPEQTLALLHAILPNNVMVWPWGIEDIIDRISEADEKLKMDERLIELNRKWRSR